MELIVIVLLIALFSTGMFLSYIPYSLQHLAEKAGLGKFSFQFMVLKLQKVPVKEILYKYDELTNTGFSVDFSNFIHFYKENPDRFFNVVKILSQHNSNSQGLSFTDFIEYSIREDQILRLTEILQLTKTGSIFLTKEEIVRIADAKFNVLLFFELLEKSKRLKYEIKSIHITDQTFETYQKWIGLIEAVSNNEDISNITFLKNEQLSLLKKIEALEAYLKLSGQGLNPNMEELISLATANMNLTTFVNALLIINKNPIDGIDRIQIKNHSLKHGNPESVVTAVIKLRNKNVPFDIDQIFDAELNNPDFNKLSELIIHPFDYKVEPPILVLLADGYQIRPEINISITYTSDCFIQVPDHQQLNNMINAKAYDILSTYKSYQELMSDLTKISGRIHNEVRIIISEPGVFGILLESAKITDIEIIANKLEAVKEMEAYEIEKELKKKKMEEKNKFHEDLDKALKSGEISYKEYQKEKYIFNSDNDSDLPYHTS